MTPLSVFANASDASCWHAAQASKRVERAESAIGWRLASWDEAFMVRMSDRAWTTFKAADAAVQA
jgi:hypothetical protein